MKRLAALSLATVVAFGALQPSPSFAGAEIVSTAETELRLEIGKGRLIRLDRPAATVFIADPNVADVQVRSPTMIYIVGKAPGGTTLHAVDASENVVASMSVSVGFDAARLQAAFATHSPQSQVQVTSVNDALVLTGRTPTAAEGEELLRMAARFVGGGGDAPGRIVNRITVEAPNQINLRVQVAEVSKEAQEVLGFNWEGLGQFGSGVLGLAVGSDIIGEAGKILRPSASTGAVAAGLAGQSGSIATVMEALERKGLVSILAEPNLTAVSGEAASFLAGGEYPIPVPQGADQITIEYKKFGVSLAFVATILDGGRINLNVRPEVSQLSSNGAITLNGVTVPALTTRRAETTVDLASGQSFAIAGLLQNTTSREVSKFPGLGDTPVLGTLFRSKRFQRNQSELVIIVTPYLVKPVSRPLETPTDLFRPASPDSPAPALAATTGKEA